MEYGMIMTKAGEMQQKVSVLLQNRLGHGMKLIRGGQDSGTSAMTIRRAEIKEVLASKYPRINNRDGQNRLNNVVMRWAEDYKNKGRT